MPKEFDGSQAHDGNQKNASGAETTPPPALHAPSPPLTFSPIASAIRVRHWPKNILIFFPAIAGHVALSDIVVVQLLLGFVAMSLVASIVYVINDLIDLEHDRSHPVKRFRPIASGELSRTAAARMLLVLVFLAVLSTMVLPDEFTALLVVYLCLNIAYSLVLKRLAVVDLITLVTFYLIRLMGGAILADVNLTGWFLAFFSFMLVSVAFAKRVAELKLVTSHSDDSGRGYVAEDISILQTFGIGCAITGILVYCLYITGDTVKVLYMRPELLWGGFPLLLYWAARMWIMVGRGRLKEDPTIFMIMDPRTYLVAVGLLVVLWAANVGLVIQ